MPSSRCENEKRFDEFYVGRNRPAALFLRLRGPVNDHLILSRSLQRHVDGLCLLGSEVEFLPVFMHRG